MVFSNLQNNEKNAFFSLLDEYFASRPEIFAQAQSSASGGSTASAIHRAIASNPETASKLASAAFKHGIPKSNPGTPSDSTVTSTDSESLGSVAGRIAAFSSQNSLSGNTATTSPHRTPPIITKSPGPNLVSTRRMGDVDTSSPQNMFSSVLNSSANKKATHQPPPAPSAFASKKNPFAPPPARQAEPPAPVPPQRPQPEEEEKEGEWAEALYDYDSTEAGDLNIRANQRVLVVERDSDDWWTGEFNGKRGLFPASYVQIL